MKMVFICFVERSFFIHHFKNSIHIEINKSVMETKLQEIYESNFSEMGCQFGIGIT